MTNSEFKKELTNEYDGLLLKLSQKYAQGEEAKELRSIAYETMYNNNDITLDERTSAFKRFISVCVRNMYINSYRKQKNENVIDISDVFDVQELGVTEQSHSLDETLYGKCISLISNKFSEENINMFKMYLEGFKFKEISDKYKVNENSVKTRVYRIKSFLINNSREFEAICKD
jgi:RNA polymerase sigma-70 factor (ECF subfamily)